MTPQTVCLRADPARVRVSVQRAVYRGAPAWRASVRSLPDGDPVTVVDEDAVMAVTDALRLAAMFAGMPGIDLDGADYPHPQRREP